ncbi:hypothetical protein BJ742DRAFT_192159 [Cladochytrium replicatum]|nr:hypothetical protein BJ742DRAFT_192159 [Cladochytrium replicatum]
MTPSKLSSSALSVRSLSHALLLLIACIPSVYSKGGGGGGGGKGGGGSSGGSRGGGGSSSSGGSGGSGGRGVTVLHISGTPQDTEVTATIAQRHAGPTTQSLLRTTKPGVAHTCSEVAKASVYEAQLDGESDNTATIIIIVVVVVLVLICAGTFGWCFFKRRRALQAKVHDKEYTAAPVYPAIANDNDPYPVYSAGVDEDRPAYSAESSWNNASSTVYENAKAFQVSSPPPSEPTPTAEQQWGIRDRGFGAFSFVTSDPANVSTTFDGAGIKSPTALGHSDIKIGVHFHPSQTGNDAAILSELPLGLDPNGAAMNREFYYFEVTVEELSFQPHSTIVSVGLATRPYPPFRMIGHNKYSVGYHSDDGRCFVNDSFGGRNFGSPFSQGNVVGCGYVQATGSVFFTLNGVLVGEATTIEERVLHPYHAAVAADGPARLSINFGQAPFMYENANPATPGYAGENGAIAFPEPAK